MKDRKKQTSTPISTLVAAFTVVSVPNLLLAQEEQKKAEIYTKDVHKQTKHDWMKQFSRHDKKVNHKAHVANIHQPEKSHGRRAR